MFKKLIIVLAITAVCFAGVSTTTNRMPAYTCNGALTQFTFNFPVNQSTDLDVVLYNIATATATTLVKDTHYTISATNNDFSSGGTVTTLSTYSSSYKIFLVRSTDLTQGTTLISDSGVLRTASLVTALDKQVLISQDLSEKVGRCISFPVQDVNITNTLPDAATRANKYLAFNASGVPVTTAGTTSSIVTSVYGASLVGAADAAAARTLLEVLPSTVAGNLDFQGYKITNYGTPSGDDDVADIGYVKTGTFAMTNKTLTAPTLTSPVINTGVSGTAIDTDGTLVKNSDTNLPSQKAVKTYVDSKFQSCRIYLGSEQSNLVASNATVILFGTDSIDTSNISSLANNRIVPTKAGVYFIKAQWTTTSASTEANKAYIVSILKNNSAVATNVIHAIGATAISPSISTIISLNGTTDYVQASATAASTGNTVDIQGNSASTYLELYRIGD